MIRRLQDRAKEQHNPTFVTRSARYLEERMIQTGKAA